MYMTKILTGKNFNNLFITDMAQFVINAIKKQIPEVIPIGTKILTSKRFNHHPGQHGVRHDDQQHHGCPEERCNLVEFHTFGVFAVKHRGAHGHDGY
jgi:hypothetical protein